MQKMKFLILLTVSLVFLVLSVGIIAPIQAQLTVQTSSKFSPQAMESAFKNMTIQKPDNKTLVIQTQYEKTTVQKISDSHYKMTIVNSTGYTMTLEMSRDKNSNPIIMLNGKQIKNPAAISNSTLSSIQPNNVAAGNLPVSLSGVSGQLTGIATPMTDNINYFQWDGVQYVSGGSGSSTIRYPHPNEDYYGIGIYSDWSIRGNNLLHSMLNYFASISAGELGPAGIAGIIGAAVGAAIGGWIGAAVGGVVALVYGVYLYYFLGYQTQDENLNIWYWQSLPFLDYLSANADWLGWLGQDAYPFIEWQFITTGYLRIGEYAFWDALGVGAPSPPPPPADPYWVSSITQTWNYGSGAVNNAWGLAGSSNDGSYVQLWGGNYNDGGQIVGWMDDTAHGHIYLYGHSGDGYYSHVYTYVSYNNNNDWTQTSSQTVTGTNDRWIDCGSYGGSFRYIAIVGIDDNGMSCNFFIDSVTVNP